LACAAAGKGSVEMILELLAKGATWEEILEDYPELEPDDLLQLSR